MKQEISTPHEKLFKQLLGEPENAASFLANNLAAEVVSPLDLTTLQVVRVSFIDGQFIQSEADLLFSVTIANRPGYVYFLPDFQCRLFDLSPFGKDRLAGNALVRILGDLLGAFGRPDFEERVRRALDTLNELMNAPGFARYLEILFRYILQVFDIPKEDLGHLVTRTLKPDVKELLMTTYEQLRREGEQIGANRVLIRLLSKRFPGDTAHLMPLLNRLSPEPR